MARKLQWRLGSSASPTVLSSEEGRVSLVTLLGLPGEAAYRSPETEGIFELASTLAPQGHLLTLLRAVKLKQGLRLTLACPEGLAVSSEWQHDPATGVLRRRDQVTNRSKKMITLLRALPRFTLAQGRYAAYAQSSGWGAESQGAWQDLAKGSALEWSSERGRLCQTAAPYLCVVPKAGGDGLAVHIATVGNWCIRLRSVEKYFFTEPPFAVLSAGLSDRNLALKLKPGESFALPELLLQRVPGGTPHRAASALHKYLLARDLAHQPRKPPVVFNSWFDRYDDIDPIRLRDQAAVAKSLGCEVFTVDAGWFGRAGIRWDRQVGCWTEKPDAAFRGRMLDFAHQVRSMGLGFGIWMEPERVSPSAPVAKEHPDWLIESAAGQPEQQYRLDLENPRARAWIKAEVSRVIRSYGAVWLKVDSNFAPGADARGRELAGYFAAWWKLLDEWRAEHPGTFIEGCSSGAMRLDLSALTHHDAHFLSDNVNPRLQLRYLQGTALRVPPSRLTLWTVLKGDGKGGVVGPKVHNLADPVPVDPDFIAALCLPGIFTLSGDALSLPKAARDRLRHWISFWKARREFITSAACHLLTPPQRLEDMSGWAALELEAPKDPRRLLLAYRMDEAAKAFTLRPVSLEPRRRYTLVSADGEMLGVKRGAELMGRGLRISLNKRFSARVIELRPVTAK
jgi:alpha-galactosidase